MSTPYYADTDHFNNDGTMTILRCATCHGRLRVRLNSADGFMHEDRPECRPFPQAIPSRIAIPLEQ